MEYLKAIYIHQGVQYAGVVREYIEAKDGWSMDINHRGNVIVKFDKRPGEVMEISFTNIKAALWGIKEEPVKEPKKG